MSPSHYAKCPCSSCGLHLEYPLEVQGTTIDCPGCQQPTLLQRATVESESSRQSGLCTATIQAAFQGRIPRERASFLYQTGLLIVALAMIALPLIYLALVAAAGWAVYHWATGFTYLITAAGTGRGILVMLFVYLTPLFAGLVLFFFMIKPLFARRPAHAQPLALNPGAEPMLFLFVTKICESVGAPFPARIDIDCQLNAAAGFRRGLLSFLGNDLVLTIGLPLVAGLNLRQFAGVLAHEFGHFSQGFGMRVTYVIRSINAWFARVVYERDAWDVMLEEAAETEDIKVSFMVGVARLGVYLTRQVLRLLMLTGHGIGCFMLRQMEYDADRYEIKLAGSQAFEDTMRRMHVLGAVSNQAYKELRVSWNTSKKLPDDLCGYLMSKLSCVGQADQERWENSMGLEPTGIFDTHPSNGDRIRKARQAGDPGLFALDGPATALFANYQVMSKMVTTLHYEDDLGLPREMVILTPAGQSTPQPSPHPDSLDDPLTQTGNSAAGSEAPSTRLRLKH